MERVAMSFGPCVRASNRIHVDGCASSLQLRDIHTFNSLTGPLRLAEKREARFDARVIQEATYGQAAAELSPPVPLHERGHDLLQRDAV